MKKLNLLTNIIFTVVIVLASSCSVNAEIIEQSNDSFTVKHSFVSDINITIVQYEFGHAERWWMPDFTQSGQGENMFFNKTGLYENMPNGKTVTHLRKVSKGLWVGALGLLKGKNIDGEMKVSIKRYRHGTKVIVEYKVKSDVLAQQKKWATYIDSMFAAQMENLQISLNKRMTEIRTIIR
jgi:hypothetical protein